MTITETYCDFCDDPIEEGGEEYLDGDTLCCECATSTAFCSRCEERVCDDELDEVCGEDLCSNCWDEYVLRCAECNTNIIIDHHNTISHPFGDDIFFCSNDCFNEQYFTCNDCGDTFPRSEMEGGGYCSICWDGEEVSYGTSGLYQEPRRKFFLTRQKRLLDTKGFTIAVELETYDQKRHSRIKDFKNITDDDKKIFSKRICIKTDGSLCTSSGGLEFTTLPTNNDETYKTIRTLCDGLTKNSFVIRQDCGYHLHIGEQPRHTTRLTKKNRHKIMILYAIYKKTLFRLLNMREGNTYCDDSRYKLGAELFLKEAQDNPESFYRCWFGRYNLINFNAWSRHNTIEVRAHEGTINFETVLNWAKLNIALYDFAIKNSYHRLLQLRGSFNELCKKIIPHETRLQKFYKKRYIKHKAKPNRVCAKTIVVNDAKRKLRPTNNMVRNRYDNIRITKDNIIPEIAVMI